MSFFAQHSALVVKHVNNLNICQVMDAEALPNSVQEQEITAWRIEKVSLQENWVWPICLYNKGDELDSAQTQKYFLNTLSVSKYIFIRLFWGSLFEC
jgi:hypothetical protein